MGDLRERPLRLKATLTREFVDQRVKMAEFQQRRPRRRWSTFQVLAAWIVGGVVLTFLGLVWWLQ